MKKMRKLLCLALALAMVLALAACGEAGGDASGGFKVTFYDSDGTTVLAEVNAEEGQPVAEPELAKEGYVIQGYYATPALVIPYDMSAPVTADTSVFVAWQSSVADERAWMLAGSLAGYPDNGWGMAWPQDDFLLQPVEGEFNVFAIEVNLYEGDQFKIAVIDQDYNWSDIIDASHLVESEYFAGGEDAFNSGANIVVAQSGLYKLVLKTDAETISLCSLSAERLGDAAELAAPEFDFQLQGTFNNWGEDPESFKMLKNGDDNIWYYLLTVTEADYDTQNDLDAAMFGVKNLVNGDWYDPRNLDPEASPNFTVPAGTYIVWLEIELKDNQTTVKNFFVEEPAYYVVGTCGNAGWAADANAENTAYKMQAQDDGTYKLDVTFTEEETEDWTEGNVAFKIAYGAGGCVANEYWYGDAAGENILVAPGSYTIVFDPATGAITY